VQTRTANVGASPRTSDVAFWALKNTWNNFKKLLGDPNFPSVDDITSDAEEMTMLNAMRDGKQSFSDFFTGDFMKKNCPDLCEQK